MVMLLLCLVALVASVGRAADGEEEGVHRLNAYLESSRSAATMGIEKGEMRNGGIPDKVQSRHPPLSDIGKCVSFQLDMHTWSDQDMVAARVTWGQLQNFLSRCGNEYSEVWCLSVVAHIKNSVAYRELELAVLAHGAKHSTTRRQDANVDDDENKENEGDSANTLVAYSRAVRKYLEKENKREPVKIV